MVTDDPRAPYKVYEGDEVKGTYATRAEARRAQQQLAESAPESNYIIRDVLGDLHDVRAEEGGDPAQCPR
jgi:hypothetical protein